MRLSGIAVLIFIICIINLSDLAAKVHLPSVIGSNMVLQREKPINIWGWADPGESVTVRLQSVSQKTKADADGAWTVSLPPMDAGGPYKMTVSGSNTITLDNILIGEVWICSGQSNMEFRMRSVDNNVEELVAASHPNIRLFRIPRTASPYPQKDVNASWEECTPATVADFSGVAYFFGRRLREELNVPVGLVMTCWGGTRIEPWTPPVGFKSVPELKDISEKIQSAEATYRSELEKSLTGISSWLPEAKEALAKKQSIPAMPQLAEHPLSERQQPTAIYNGQIRPIVPFSMRGVIWYQGESNRKDGMIYYEKMKALIQGWRAIWKEGDFPFYYVQLATYSYSLTDKSPGTALQLPVIREAQRKALVIPNTGMAVTTDIGNVFDIHPRNKQEVGRRLALWALAGTYGHAGLVYSGPLYRSIDILDGRIRVNFTHTGSGLKSRDGQPLNWFEVAGSDQKFVRARATIDGDAVMVWSPEVENPQAVRFGWSEIAIPNLVNEEGLPASPFNSETK